MTTTIQRTKYRVSHFEREGETEGEKGEEGEEVEEGEEGLLRSACEVGCVCGAVVVTSWYSDSGLGLTSLGILTEKHKSFCLSC